ncbi:MAG: response regulator [Magnetococcales bacterium]|nr:response regulator [Magnetococcales bacterium]
MTMPREVVKRWRKRLSRLPLLVQLGVASLAVFFVMFQLVTEGVLGLEQDHLEQELHTRFENRADLFVATTQDAVVSRDWPILDGIITETVAGDKDLVFLHILDRDLQTMADWQRKKNTPLKHSLITFTREVNLAGEHFGRVTLTWDTTSIRETHRHHYNRLRLMLIGFGFAAAFALGGTVYFLVIRPVKRIHHQLGEIHRTQRIKPGVRVSGSLEINHLGRAVNRIAELVQLLDESRVRFRDMFEHMMVGAVILKPDGNDFLVLDMNHTAEALHRKVKSQCLGRRAREVFPFLPDLPVWGALQSTIAQAWSRPVPPYLYDDGQVQGWRESHVYRLNSGELVWMDTDISAKKHAERLRREKDAAEQANAMKSTFLAAMSHEIRTPINGMLGMIELLRGSRLKGNQRRWVEGLRDSGEILLATINDILDFSKIEAGRMTIESSPFSLDHLLKNLINTTVARAHEKNLELVIYKNRDVPDTMVGDSFRLQQVLSNLVSNAVKFTPSGEIVLKIAMPRVTEGPSKIEFSVQDTGIGIASEHIHGIFCAFDQGDNATSRLYGGTGLGLAICKRLVNAMGGSIHVESLLGSGSTFRVTLPWSPSPESVDGETAIERTVHALCGLKNATALDCMKRTLADLDFVSFGYRDEDSMFKEIDRWRDRVEIAFLDVNLNGSDMVILTQRLRSQPGLAHLPVVYLLNTHDQHKGDFQRLEKVPDSSMIIKPVYGSQVLDVIMELLEKRTPSATRRWGVTETWKEMAARGGVRERLLGGRVLLVEDNEINRIVAQEALILAGLEIEVAANGMEALKILEKKQFDGVLMDIQMPVLDGYKTTQIIRNRLELTHLPIIAMTAGVQSQERDRCLAAGMNDHIGKPLDYALLLEKMVLWIHPSRANTVSSNSPSETTASLVTGENREQPVFENLPGIDVALGLNMLGNNVKLYRKLLDGFFEIHSLSGLNLLAAINAGDLPQAIRLTHTLKSVAGTLGAQALRDHAANLELTLKKNDASDSDRLQSLLQLLEEFELVLTGIRSLKHVANVPGKQEHGSMGEKIIGKLQTLVHQADTRAIRLFHKHREQLATLLPEESLQTLEEQLGRYEMKKAAETLTIALIGKP